MTDRGREFGKCSCEYGCACPLGSPKPTLGICETMVSGQADEEGFGATRLDGLFFAAAVAGVTALLGGAGLALGWLRA